jgi:hypothetical protein
LWHGTKGLFVTAPWCHVLTIVLENMRPQEFEHFDIWLKKRLQKKNWSQAYTCVNLLLVMGIECR